MTHVILTIIQTCDRAASRILQLLKQWHLLFDLAYTNITMPQIAFTAGTTHLLAAVQHRSAKRHKEAISSAQDCVKLLRRIGISWMSGSQKADILENLINEYVCAGPLQNPTDVPAAKPAPAVAQTNTPPQLFGIGVQGQAYQPAFLVPGSENAPLGNSADPSVFPTDFSTFGASYPEQQMNSSRSFGQDANQPPFYNLIPTASQTAQTVTPSTSFDHRRYSVGQQRGSQPIDLPMQQHPSRVGSQPSTKYVCPLIITSC